MERNGKTKDVFINPSYEHSFVYPIMQTSIYLPFFRDIEKGEKI